MKDFFILRLLDKGEYLFTKLGVNYRTLRSILNVKLIMDERRVPTVLSNDEEKEGNYFKKSLFIYALMGVFMLVFMIPSFPLFFKMSIIYGLLLFMIISSLISDFSSVLLDVNEKNILLPKPVDYKTLNMAKTIHVLIYLLTISLAISGPLIIAGTIIYGISFLGIFLVQLFSLLGFSIFTTSLLYYLILRLFDGEKLKDIINYFQIGFTLLVTLSYQFVGRAFGFIDLDIVFTPRWWTYILPPTWFSAPFVVLLDKDYSTSIIWLSILGVVVSICMLVIYLKLIAPYFDKNLAKLSDNSGKLSAKAKKRAMRKLLLSKIFLKDKNEQTFYKFTKRMIASERKFKLRLFPSLGFSVIFPLIFLFNNVGYGQSFESYLDSMKNSSTYFVLYVSLIMLISALPMISISEKYNAAWVYQVIPLNSGTPIYSGATKALVINYFSPAFMISSGLFVWVFGARILPDLLIIFFNLLLLIMFVTLVTPKDLPFSQDFKYIKDKSTKTFFYSIGFIIVSVVAHFLVRRAAFGLYIYMAISMIAIKFFWQRAFK
ncbi:ABC transporter permease [Alkalicella caledoniensis]|uniref:ABC transporter permease n=1 Tax=Alkalicella caledoniensis TaxID=2731377 RepID=A0A7G9W5I3_ALKCA|nr:ABC transporter permease [Alkalicella caledoniensis]QNO13945.1 ABC transporter permease [Alkalicella caledoniensis]